MASIRKSLLLTIAQQYGCAAISFFTIVVLARLLTPTEVGIFAVSAAIIGVAHMLRDFGIGRYLIQERDLTSDRLRTAFGLGILIAWAIAGVLYIGRSYAASFYGEQGVQDVLAVLACNFLFIPFGAPILWMLSREMRFERLFVVNIITTVVQSALSIAMAVLGFSYMSLAWGSLAGVIATVLLAFILDQRHALLLPSLKEWRRVLSFGSWASAQSLVTEMGAAATDLVLGRTLGFAAVGIYSRAQGIIATIQRDIMKAVIIVALPAFAERCRKGLELGEPYRKGMASIAVVVWPLSAYIGWIAYPLVDLLFGQTWMAAAPLLQIMCLTAFLSPLGTLGGQVLLATGRVRTVFVIEFVTQSLRVATIVIGSFFGIEVVAALQLVPASVAAVLWLRHAREATGIGMEALLRPGAQSIAVTLASSIGPILVLLFLGSAAPFVIVAAAGMLSAAGWLLGVVLVRHPVAEELYRLLQFRPFGYFSGLRSRQP